MPAHIKDARGSSKIERRTPVKCATCPQLLRSVDLKDGCRRCLACRKANPGRPVKPKEGPGTRTDHPDWLTVKSKEIQPPATESWWTRSDLTREQFQQEASTKKYSGKRSDAVPMSPGGFRDC